MDARIDCCGATVEIVPYCKSRPIVDPGGSRSQGDACASDNRGPHDGPEVCPLAFLASEDAVFGRLSPALIRTVLLREPRVQSGPTPLGLFRYCTAKLMATALPQSQAIHIDADDRGYVQGQHSSANNRDARRPLQFDACSGSERDGQTSQHCSHRQRRFLDVAGKWMLRIIVALLFIFIGASKFADRRDFRQDWFRSMVSRFHRHNANRRRITRLNPSKICRRHSHDRMHARWGDGVFSRPNAHRNRSGRSAYGTSLCRR